MRSWICATALLALAASTGAVAEDAPAAKTRVDLYGFAMLDMGYQSGQNHPDWYDVVRPTKLPSFEDEFGKDGRFFAGVRQSRFGVKSWTPTSAGELKTIFEFELFGTGDDAGQTTFRLRHAWGELGQIGAGQTWSPFMDPDVFPNSIEYWGPNGMVFFRNIQLRWTPVSGDNVFMVALERPGASGDGGVYSDRVGLTDIQARFPLPDLSAQFRANRGWGHVQVAGILREIKWDDLGNVPGDLSGDQLGWGVNLSTNFKFAEDTLRASVVYGEGIENYMNDAPVDIGITNDPNDIGEALPVLGVVLFFDYAWSEKMTSTIGYSMVDIDNSDGQAPSAFKKGQYALANILFYPVKNVMLGPEIQWGKRENNSDGFTSDDFRVQFSAKFSFGHTMGGK
jgi:hypothetical protein